MKTSELLTQLQAQVQEQRRQLAQELEAAAPAALQFKASPQSWSALECVEHLNRYSRFYNPALRRALAPESQPQPEVSFTWLGRKSIDMVRPENRKAQQTLKRMNPAQSALNSTVLLEFDEHLGELADLLERAASRNLNRRAVPVEFFQLLKLRTGEALQFVVAHQARHLQQARRAMQQAESQAHPLEMPHLAIG